MNDLTKNFLKLHEKNNFNSNIHPLTVVTNTISEILRGMDFKQISSEDEIESVDFNFNKLNIPEDHPARSLQDTFFLDYDLLLRTHTSNTQIRVLQKSLGKSIRAFSFGKVYRREEDDATHTHQFMQLECFAIDKTITFLDLKFTLITLLKSLFNKNIKIRFRHSFFPFTEPSIEVDIECINCENTKEIECFICKNTRWVEVLGAGLIHPKILKEFNYDTNEYTGFAFGIGIERILMIKYKLKNIKDLYSNDILFINKLNF